MPSRSRSTPTTAALLTVALAAVVTAGCFGGDRADVTVAEVAPGAVSERVAAAGRLAPASRTEVTAGVGGTVLAVEFADGDEVREGDVVVRVDEEELEAAIAEVEQARASLDGLDGFGGTIGALPSPDPGGGGIGPVPTPPGGLTDVIGDLDDLEDLPNPAEPIVAELDAVVLPALATAREELPEALEELQEALDDLQTALDTQRATLIEFLEGLPEEVREDLDLDDLEDLPALVVPEVPDEATALAGIDAIEEGYEQARAALLEAGAEVRDAQTATLGQLAEAADSVAAQVEVALSATVAQVVAAQVSAVDAIGGDLAALLGGTADPAALLGADPAGLAGLGGAQEAELAALSSELVDRRDDLEARAPVDGVIELGPADGAAAPGDLGGLPDLGDLGGLGGLGANGFGDLGGLSDGAPSGASDGPITEGTEVRAGQVLFTVYDLSSWLVEADIDELDARAVAEGQTAEVTLDAFPGEVFRAEVDKVGLTPTSAAGAVAYPARLRLLERPEDPPPRIGMSASVEILTSTVEVDTVVPSRAVVRRDDENVVYVLEGDTVRLVAVELLAFGDDAAAVSGALAPGDLVVVAGYEDLVDGDRVTVDEDAVDDTDGTP